MPTTKLGLPCWHKENVEQAIRPIARTDEEGVDYFLASHSPVGNIRHDRTGEEFNEESLFKTLFSSKSEPVLALIHGDPGTGKSHLIHWLKLRTEDELRQRKIKNVKAVLIQRRTGSLKDALEQMIEQLGEDFKHYLSPVQEALSRISSDIAKEKFIDSIAIELRPQQRADKKREPLPRRLKDIAEICHSQGFRSWLCRENGVADAVIKQLNEKHSPENEDFATNGNQSQFTSAELLPDAIYRKPKDNTETVRNLIEDLEFEEDLLEQAVKFLNEVLPDAVKEMTGLSGTNLRSIFDRIRADLKKRGETLALFIEDVSVMSALDEEVFTAVEPQTRNDLCRMIAVLGSTNQGLNRLMDNQKDRITHPISLGGKATAVWQKDTRAIAEFAARYLNTVRLTREEISAVATYRRNGGDDINISACDRCPVRDDCHPRFGKMQVGTVQVGLYPFSVIAPRQLLNDLSGKFATQKNARGLLTQILLPALDSNYESLETGKFPNADKFAVVRHEVSFWGPFKQMYCGGWEEPEIKRLEFLAQGWVQAENADELAAQLSPFLAPLNFREFSKRTTKVTKAVSARVIERPAEPQKPAETATNTKLNKIRQSLKNWVEGEKLSPDVEPRQLLAGLIRKSIAWNDSLELPLEERRKALGGASDDDEVTTRSTGYAFVRLEGQTSEPATVSQFVDLPRNEETRSLIEALAQFTYAGNNSWNFEHGEYHKRIVAQWLRRNQSKIIEQLKPPSDLDTNAPIASAVQILSTGAMVRQRTKLSSELPELLKSMLADSWSDEPFALSSEWKSLIKDMQLKHKEILRFLTNELNVPQGIGGINFINAIPALTAALDFAASPKIQIPSDDYYQRFWKSRYSAFQNKSRYANFVEALKAEHVAIGEVLENIKFGLRGFGYDTENLPDALAAFCSDLIELLKIQAEAKETYPYTPFEDLGRGTFANRKDVWQTAVKRAQIVVADEDVIQTLTFNPQTLKEAENALTIAFDYVSKVENYVKNRLQNFEQEGDPDLLKDAIFESLENIEQMRS